MNSKRPFIRKAHIIDEIMAPLRGVLSFFALIPLLLIINCVQMVSFAIIPFSKNACWSFNRSLAFFWWGLVSFWLEKVNRTKIHFSGDKITEHENAIILPNHQSMADIPPLLSFSWRTHSTGTLKFFVKDALKWIPGPGWGMYFLGCPFLKRNWKKDKPAVLKTLNTFKNYDVPIWLISFLEGTRATPTKILEDQQKTLDRGLEPFQHHLFPKKAGIIATIQGMRGHATAVYNVTIGYPDGIPTLWHLFMGVIPGIHLHIQRIDMNDVPFEDDAIYEWAIKVFQEKDELMYHFARSKQFPDEYYSHPWNLFIQRV